ncbi:1,4-dihydroxy-2-naphthoate octaprenyltransferase [Bifidobacterium subtile]|jgi:1,4-dihydroxy-2-naphthoate octaprenyltransferase|uniref:1,4-dihydroxy-2-naphthoate octaprenyltransferase n=1 Tax=Bifidobacterium subtile TaxID=77635 RepID=A0A087E3T7_9BIFI|nr:1,4-dihydroxy-2-naphthoate octaprenyltransferase [Bifidobacterium subtile]KFJ02438.1 1,4-dihydroxy-2-naphthoate octaprenyltransferase [Bifidobacterium subtile]QOL35891.1 1,4-dihydroxy-2-naphthoate octaprenyltransferase [Bifidobacterium subtile]
MKLGLWIQGARPKTLPLGLAPVIAAAMTMWQPVFEGVYGGSYDHKPCPVFDGRPNLDLASNYGRCLTSHGWYIAVTLLCAGVAVFLQIAANFANDYSDGVRGVDSGRDMRNASTSGAANITGGAAQAQVQAQSQQLSKESAASEGSQRSQAPSRLVASGVAPKKVLAAAGISAALACACGLAIIVLTGHWWLLALGVVCIVAGWFYVGGKHPYGYHGWGEISVFAFFGLIATCGTSYALSDTVPYVIIWVAVAQGLLAVAVLSVNNLRDVDEDAAHGKRTWMVRMGRSGGKKLTEMLIVVPALMLTAEFAMRHPWTAAAEKVDTACGWQYSSPSDSVGREVCDYSHVAYTQHLFVVTAAAFALSCIVCVAAAIYVHREKYRAALPLCALSSLALAFAFGTLHLL